MPTALSKYSITASQGPFAAVLLEVGVFYMPICTPTCLDSVHTVCNVEAGGV